MIPIEFTVHVELAGQRSRRVDGKRTLQVSVRAALREQRVLANYGRQCMSEEWHGRELVHCDAMVHACSSKDELVCWNEIAHA